VIVVVIASARSHLFLFLMFVFGNCLANIVFHRSQSINKFCSGALPHAEGIRHAS
jgi:hypothetical protein